MGRGGTGLSSCASAWSGAAATKKKDRQLIAAGSLPSIAPPPKCARLSDFPIRKINLWFIARRRFPPPWSIIGDAYQTPHPVIVPIRNLGRQRMSLSRFAVARRQLKYGRGRENGRAECVAVYLAQLG